jgi:hypothetical protein
MIRQIHVKEHMREAHTKKEQQSEGEHQGKCSDNLTTCVNEQ